ncbi:hypothetical protein [Burkholderia cepacia]|uniref:hypothetical protein n=1 Tax=Burkholderia cepacia TaxID=292 RepID=UPI00158DFB52|nr:hypothetical protein [Burkholderia cepacia]
MSRALSIMGSAYAEYFAANGYDLVLIDEIRSRLNAMAEELTTRFRSAVEVVVADHESALDLASIKAKVNQDASIVSVIDVTKEGSYPLLSVEKADALIEAIEPNCTITGAAVGAFSSRSGGVCVLITASSRLGDLPWLA